MPIYLNTEKGREGAGEPVPKPTLSDPVDPDRLGALIQTIIEDGDGRRPLDKVLAKSGFEPKEVLELCQRPDALSRMLSAATTAFLIPVLPIVFRELAANAAAGQERAQQAVLNLLGDKSPLKEKMGVDMQGSSDQHLKSLARQLIAQLGEIEL